MGDRPFLVYPAELSPHKNHVTLLEALARLRREHQVDLQLVLAGSDQGNKRFVLEQTAEMGLSDAVHLRGFVDRSEPVALYQHALALTYVSTCGPGTCRRWKRSRRLSGRQHGCARRASSRQRGRARVCDGSGVDRRGRTDAAPRSGPACLPGGRGTRDRGRSDIGALRPRAVRGDRAVCAEAQELERVAAVRQAAPVRPDLRTVKILVLSQWYPPEPQSVVSDLAETLAEQGHDVSVLTGFPNWPSGRLYPGYRVRLLQRETMNGVPVSRVPLFPYHGRSAIGRVLNLASFCLAAIVVGPFAVKRPDVIHAIQPPTTCLPAWVLSRVWRVPFTYEVQDLWPDTLRATGMVSKGGTLGLVDRYCRWVRKAAAIMISRVSARAAVARRAGAQDLGDPELGGHDPLQAGPVEPHADAAQTFHIVYAGNLGLARARQMLQPRR